VRERPPARIARKADRISPFACALTRARRASAAATASEESDGAEARHEQGIGLGLGDRREDHVLVFRALYVTPNEMCWNRSTQ